jgi:glycosyltransferase involved in cell wall biosynthesis
MIADWDLQAARRIRARMKTWRPDIVHAHDARSHALALLALLGSKTPLIVTRRVIFPPKSIGLKYGERVTRFIAISSAVRDAMVSRGIAPERISVVHSGVNLPSGSVTPRDWRSELRWPADSILLGVIGAMTAEKGLDSLDPILKALQPEIRKRVRIILLGGSNHGATTIGGTDAYFAGFVDAIEEATSGLDIVIHPARSEGLGTSVIDAMALGIPVVAFGVGGLPEVITPGTGFLVPPGDSSAFAEKIASLAGDAALRKSVGAAGSERARQFGSERMTLETEAVYQSVLNG